MPDHVSRETTAPQTTTRSPAEPAPGCYLLDGDLLVVLGVVDGHSSRLVSFMRPGRCGRDPLLVLEAWPRRAQRLTGDRADDVLLLAQLSATAGHRAAVRDGEREYGEHAALLNAFARLAGRLQQSELSRG